ncbi:MAG: hypothetical protein KDA52_04230 [Planctomycetaceae bacterium]|nr:hypothetical protein [Planctomycetaceae bacterium]
MTGAPATLQWLVAYGHQQYRRSKVRKLKTNAVNFVTIGQTGPNGGNQTLKLGGFGELYWQQT